MLAQFDYPDPNVHSAARATTISPTQKLFALNNPFVLARADDLARRLVDRSAGDDADRIREAYARLFSRSPSAKELSIGLDFVSGIPETHGTDRWATYAQALLASNEMLYLD